MAIPFLKLGTRFRGLRPAELAKKWLVARDETCRRVQVEPLGRVGGLRHFRVLRDGDPPGSEPSRGEQRRKGGLPAGIVAGLPAVSR